MKIIAGLCLLATLIVGEVLSIYKFINSDFEPSYKREIIYGVGVFTGLGCVIGYMDIPDTKIK